jgi:prepilin-type processing-associated H-X9-DG protein
MCMGDAPITHFLSHLGNDLLDTTSDWSARASTACSRGFFMARKESKFRDVLDGLANTIAMGEIVTDLGDRDKRSAISWDRGGSTLDTLDNPSHCADSGEVDPERPGFWCPATGGVGCTPPVDISQSNHESRGMNWANFRSAVTECYTTLPPNRESCVGQWVDGPGALPPSSRHQGGAHVLMGDGAVIFMTDSVEAGDSRANGIYISRRPGDKSPYGLWGALGTKAGKESIEEQLNQ